MPLHRLLARQLRKLGIDPEQLPTDSASWRDFLEAVDRTYATADQDRYTLERSLRLSSDEMRELNHQLRERYVEMERQFFQTQRLDSIGRLAGGVAHDFNNILGVILNYTEMVREQLGEQTGLREDVDEVIHAAQRGAELTRQLLAFGRREVVKPEVIDLDEAIRGVERMLRTTVGEDVRLEIIRASDQPTIEIDPTRAEQVFVNLTMNARDAMPKGGALRYTTSEWLPSDSNALPHPNVPPGHWIVLTVEDDGVGMPQEVLDQVFDPFFTTKNRGAGTGMGLATVYGIVRQAGGHVVVDSGVGEGTKFQIFFPKRERIQRAVVPSGELRKLDGTGKTVLVLEDEPALLKVLQRLLAANGFRVLQAASGKVAREVFDEATEPIDLILSDVVMPDGSGPEFVDHLVRRGVCPRVLFMSGYPLDAIDQPSVFGEGVKLIHKPFDHDALLHAIADVLSGAGSGERPPTTA